MNRRNFLHILGIAPAAAALVAAGLKPAPEPDLQWDEGQMVRLLPSDNLEFHSITPSEIGMQTLLNDRWGAVVNMDAMLPKT